MLLQDRQKRRDTWCPGEISQSKSVVQSKGAPSKDVEFVTPPSAKRRTKRQPSSERVTEANDSDVTCMSTDDVRQMVRDLVEERNALRGKLEAVMEGESQKSARIESMEVDLRAAYEVTRGVHVGTETGVDVEYEKLLVQLAAAQLREQEMKMEQAIASHVFQALLKKREGTSEELQALRRKLEESEGAWKKALEGKEEECEAVRSELEAKGRAWESENLVVRDLEEALRNAKQQHLGTVEELEREIHQLRHDRGELEMKVVAKIEELSVTKK